MTHEVFAALKAHDAVLFASVIPRVKPPPNYQFEHFLRKNLIFLQQRFSCFLKAKQESGLLTLDQMNAEPTFNELRNLLSSALH